MKRGFLVLAALLVLAVGTSALAQCQKDTMDRGICDTMYIEPWPADVADTVWSRPGPYFIRVPIYVTCDVVNMCDSIQSFVIPLCYTHTNPDKYCSVSAYWNVAFSFENPRSIFRHLDGVTNRMKWLYEQGEGAEWDTRILQMTSDSSWVYWWTGYHGDIKDSAFVQPYFWMSLVVGGGVDQKWWEGSRILLATITFKLEDTMQVCIDTCWWPPNSRLAWSILKDTLAEDCGAIENLIGMTKIPRSGGPDTSSFKVCFNLAPSDVKEIKGSDEVRPSQFSLSQNYPNPFNPVTNFQFTLSKSVHVKIDIFNIVGQKVKTLVSEDMKPGAYKADWDGKDEKGNPVSSGIYFYRIQAGEFSDVKKMVLLK